jgi:hypothetical protein
VNDSAPFAGAAFLIERKRAGVVVGHAARENVWPKVAAWLSEHD